MTTSPITESECVRVESQRLHLIALWYGSILRTAARLNWPDVGQPCEVCES